MKFGSPGFHPVDAENIEAAARIFAERQARSLYGRNGYCRTLRLDSATRNGRYANYEAFLGRDLAGLTHKKSDRGTTTGRSFWLAVSAL